MDEERCTEELTFRIPGVFGTVRCNGLVGHISMHEGQIGEHGQIRWQTRTRRSNDG